MVEGLKDAVTSWESRLQNNVNIRIRIELRNLGNPAIPVQTRVSTKNYSYLQVYNALNRRKISGDDKSALDSLATPPTFPLTLSRTSNNPNGSGSSTPYVDRNGDANNAQIMVTHCLAKALGIYQGVAGEVDAVITYNSQVPWSFARNNVPDDEFDYVGYSLRELGKAFGFYSGLDKFAELTQRSGPQRDSAVPFVTVLDLFRYAAQDKPEWTIDGRAKYFSVDGGETKEANFSTGIIFGDGNTASSWQATTGEEPKTGIFDHRNVTGNLGGITGTDRKALDVIGWEL